ncbi:hypothetical protein KSC_046200 [Ktedonobacter sp. SOSP1-52]|uniref:hypothetical protein n=1 Tax=Ktedonobacter sp. SOSP1-52 TaxID=2778366 RepID=UPI00191591A4|nr:hypothetical protein [Ktedonobacter sp. SOSP1-52]GHO65728.1 hypothetical protein KSC_046200 [Ktedonobacter sp. SOSP1-52]
MASKRTTESLVYHASRLLLLISLCGKPQSKKNVELPGVEGRTLLAKLDFFLRYPAYLRNAAQILGIEVSDEDLGLSFSEEENSVESHMVRYLYGPWDHNYYMALAYLIGKGLIEVEKSNGRGTEIFKLTSTGAEIVGKLSKESAYEDLARRASTTYRLFKKYNGNKLKDFIYHNFPEVVNRKIGATI